MNLFALARFAKDLISAGLPIAAYTCPLRFKVLSIFQQDTTEGAEFLFHTQQMLNRFGESDWSDKTAHKTLYDVELKESQGM